MDKAELLLYASLAGVLEDINADFSIERNWNNSTSYFKLDDYTKVVDISDYHKLYKIFDAPLSHHTNFGYHFDGGRAHCVPVRDYANGYTENRPNVQITPSVFSFANIRQINAVPYQHQNEDITYRVIKDNSDDRLYVFAHTDKEYIYLDVDFFFKQYNYVSDKNKQTGHFAVSDALTFDVGLVFALLNYNQKFFDLLDNGCFIDSRKAALYRLKMEKGLTDHQKTTYTETLNKVKGAYESDISFQFAKKLAAGEVKKGEFNNITFTADTASYQTVTVELEGLFKRVMALFNIKEEFDIYDVIKRIANNFAEDINIDTPTPLLTINGIPIQMSINEKTANRLVNGFRIKKDEVGEVVYRASCFNNAQDYTNLLKQTSILNIAATDALRNGLRLKIDSDYGQYARYNDEVHAEAPKLYFKIVNKKVHLLINEEKSVPIRLNYLVQKCKTINEKTNGRYTNHGGWYGTKDYRWARTQLKAILLESGTFRKHKKDAAGVVQTTEQVFVIDTDIDEILKFVDAKHLVAIERSKEFLRIAVQKTGAQPIKHEGKDAFLVKGNLRSYIVQKESCQVFDATTKTFICIVEGGTGHNEGVGYDAVAGRLYALKNDSVLLQRIGTLGYDNNYEQENLADIEFVEEHEDKPVAV